MLDGANATFLADLYSRYINNPSGIDPSWKAFFDDLGDDAHLALGGSSGPSWARPGGAFVQPDPIFGDFEYVSAGKGPKAPGKGVDQVAAKQMVVDAIRIVMMIRAYRIRGHLNAKLDPMELNKGVYHPELDVRTYGFTDADMDREFILDKMLGLDSAKLRDILSTLRRIYCGTIGYEFMHIMYPEQKSWLQERIEGAKFQPNFTPGGKREILRRLTIAEGFEKFLDVKYPATKRFGLEGGESLIPLMEAAIEQSAKDGCEEILFGMPHRGRLNMLANIMGKPYAAIFSEFQGTSAHPDDVQGSGDVKYHLGTSTDRSVLGQKIHMSLTANPSHLEAVNPVVIGKVRAKQLQKKDAERRKVMAVLLHGDAAFAGQGIVAECFGMSDLKGYRTGGTFHVIVNNQIGFTTNPLNSRSTIYPSETAKMVQAPIFHVNGDDPESVAHVGRMAAEFRATFQRDVVVDMICYRRHGHNESDEPGFTQPLMYKKIRSMPTTRTVYAKRLVNEGVLTQEEADRIQQDFNAHLEDNFQTAKSYKPNKADWLGGVWEGFTTATQDDRRGKTGVPIEELKKVGKALTTYPATFNVHKTIARQFDAKKKMFETGEGFDWATAEALAFGTLLLEGHGVRLSGQDCCRGTFSQRQSVLTDQETEDKYIMLNNISKDQKTYEVIDSLLSEYAVLGYELGYSLAEPNDLVMWEAQFGDFSNGAQIMFDQFISSGESKWLRMSGLVCLLPHGMEGQGPEHSSARLERFLQMSAEDNWQVANCTTPANYFHILRRQIRREFRKPLILMTPKSLLRHKLCVSKLSEMGPDSSFHRVLWDDYCTTPDDKIKRIIMCTGKVYYDLVDWREQNKITDTYIFRIEQLYPFPHDPLVKELARFPKSAKVVWCQEEHQNHGSWNFVDRRIEDVLNAAKFKNARPLYAGRPEAASPAVGSMKKHQDQLKKFLNEAFTI